MTQQIITRFKRKKKKKKKVKNRPKLYWFDMGIQWWGTGDRDRYILHLTQPYSSATPLLCGCVKENARSVCPN